MLNEHAMHQYVAGLIGGAILGSAALFLRLAIGSPLGISGFLSKALSFRPSVAGWRLSFLAGMLVCSLCLALLNPAPISEPLVYDFWIIALAGVLVGAGARIAGGCTSGHSLCGMGSMDLDSLVATLIFILSGAATVYVMGGLTS